MKSTILIFLSLLSFAAAAQKITVSEPITLRSDAAYDLIGNLGGRVLLFRDQSTTFEVEAFNEQMQGAWTKELILDDRQPKVIGIVGRKSDFLVLYQHRSKSETRIKVHKYGPGANLLDSITLANLGYLFYSPNFEFIRSEDRSKGLIFYTEKQETLHAIALDLDNMVQMWEVTVQPPDFNFYQDYRQALIDNDGNMTIVLEKNNYRSKREAHYFEMHSFLAVGKRLVQYNIPMVNKLTYDALFTFDPANNRLVGAGLYSEKNLGRSDGYFYLTIDPENPKDFLVSFSEFSEAFIANLLGKDADKSKGVDETDVREVVLRRDGGVLLIGERNRIFERRAASINRAFDDYNSAFAVDYYYDEMFIISIHPNGDFHWNTVLHKKQYSQDDDGMYSSYFLFKTPGSLRFLFNDEIKYENTVSEYVLKGNGEFERKSLLSTENLKLRLRFRDAIQVAGNELVIPSERRNRLRLVRLEYQ